MNLYVQRTQRTFARAAKKKRAIRNKNMGQNQSQNLTYILYVPTTHLSGLQLFCKKCITFIMKIKDFYPAKKKNI